MPSSKLLRNLTPYHAPALSDEQQREFCKESFNDEYDYNGKFRSTIQTFEDTMKNILISGISVEAMIQSLERYKREVELYHIVADHEVDCKKSISAQ